ncbi:uncharacterized protein BYT42DRAFT_587613, partial [Radiomyces spectabilis]|uniref:uncharacterized protein n=1 Tax=Radiomyces spectabilis TaxID=64574 RepID=UPI002220ED43
MDATCYWMPHSYIERHSSDKSLTQYGITWARLLMELWYINVNTLAYRTVMIFQGYDRSRKMCGYVGYLKKM